MDYVWSVLDKWTDLECNITPTIACWSLIKKVILCKRCILGTIWCSHVEVHSHFPGLTYFPGEPVNTFATKNGWDNVFGFKHQGLWSSGKGLSIGTTCQQEPGVTSSLNPSHQCLTYFLNWKKKAQNLHWNNEFDKDVMSCLWLINIKRWKSSAEWHKKREPPLSTAARDQMWVLRLPSYYISLNPYHS